MPEESIRGRFVWYDLMTTDPEGAKAFYAAVTGWGTQVWEEMSYTMWTVGGAPIGGTMKLPDEAVAGGARPHWLGHVAVPDVDATIARPGAGRDGHGAACRHPHRRPVLDLQRSPGSPDRRLYAGEGGAGP